VTTEDDFQKQLDAHPDDFQTRLVFADWLQERADERAEGYRALGVQRLYPSQVGMEAGPWENRTASSHECPKAQRLPPDWFKKVRKNKGSDDWWCRFLSRRTCEDAVARAFAKLPAQRRVELLAKPVPVRKQTKRRKKQRKK
jgi:uncharacterized protein (TIGR02996 family)